MYWFDLPNLTCVYRCITLISKSFLELRDLPQVNMVADVDITLSLMRLGFSRAEAQQIDAWLTLERFVSAADALDRVLSLKLRVGMTEPERQTVLELSKRTSVEARQLPA
jgi:hypothetical protein